MPCRIHESARRVCTETIGTQTSGAVRGGQGTGPCRTVPHRIFSSKLAARPVTRKRTHGSFSDPPPYQSPLPGGTAVDGSNHEATRVPPGPAALNATDARGGLGEEKKRAYPRRIGGGPLGPLGIQGERTRLRPRLFEQAGRGSLVRSGCVDVVACLARVYYISSGKDIVTVAEKWTIFFGSNLHCFSFFFAKN